MCEWYGRRNKIILNKIKKGISSNVCLKIHIMLIIYKIKIVERISELKGFFEEMKASWMKIIFRLQCLYSHSWNNFERCHILVKLKAIF